MVKKPFSGVLGRHHFRKRRGDTLVEVMLAIGIFSMVAISVVAIMNSGTNSSQASLEITLASQEISSQEEALNFIKMAYENDMQKGETNSLYGALWSRLASLAVNTDATGEIILGADGGSFHVKNCQDLYEPNGDANRGFIIDIKNLSQYEKKYQELVNNSHGSLGTLDLVQKIIIENPPDISGADPSTLPLHATTTYPRLLYQNSSSSGTLDDSTSLIDNTSTILDSNLDHELYGAEGIYVIAVRDATIIAGEDTKPTGFKFYIRTCWYSPGDQIPSTLSTLVPLGDPDAYKL